MADPRTSAAAALAAAALLLASPRAAHACQVIGMQPGGQGNMPICANHNAPYGGGGGVDYGPGAPVFALIEIGIRHLKRAHDRRKRREALEATPEYRAFLRGGWTHYDPGPPKPGEPRRCGASFTAGGKMLLLHGDTAPGSLATLTFVDLDTERSRIPPKTEPVLVEVALDQTNAPRAEVRAWQHAMSGSGAISFAVPSLQAGVDGLLDVLRTTVRMGGREVFDLEYHGGLDAQAKLRACMAGKPPPAAAATAAGAG